MIFRLTTFVCFFITGCNQPSLTPNPILPTNSKTASLHISDTPEPFTITPVINTPHLTLTPTLAPSLTASLMPSLTPLATLNPFAAQDEIIRLIATNNHCSGTCFWGIDPEVTSFSQAVRFLKTLKQQALKETKDAYSNGYDYIEKNINVTLRISASNDKIQSLHATFVGLEVAGVSGKDWLAFRPDNYLRTNGVPNQIKIIMSEGPNGRVSYSMVLIFDQMYISFDAYQHIIKPQSILHACPLVDHNIERLDLWLGPIDEKKWADWKDLTDISPLTPQDFYQILVGDPTKACFDLDYQKF